MEDCAHDEAVGEGVRVARRGLLWLSAGAVTSVLTGVRATAGQQAVQELAAPQTNTLSDLAFGDFLSHVLPLAQDQVESGGRGEDSYLMAVALAMSRLTAPGTRVREQLKEFRAEHATDGARFPIAAMVLDLDPGGGFRHHDHRDYNGVILGLEGEVRVRNYDILGDVPVPAKGETFQIRETRDDLILPGRFSMLARRDENVHDLVAGPEGGRVLDLFTFYEQDARSYYLDVETKARDSERRIYDAAWS